jgi:clan AA aspartic protease
VIQGFVDGLQARINLVICPPGQSEVEVECVVDTGFEGALTLPPAMVAALKLPFLIEINANLANDANVKTAAYQATIMWHGRLRQVAVLAMGRRALLGTALLEDANLSIDFYQNGDVIIDEL